MIKKYRKKPIIIEALKWTGRNTQQIANFIPNDLYIIDISNKSLIICTLEGHMKAKKGDYIIKGVDQEFYPCDGDIFKRTYEEIDN